MSYRLPEDRVHIVDVATKSKIVIDNGTISRISIPCYYGYHHHMFHDRMMHDHIGWPAPDHPDESCQLPDRYGCIYAINEMDLAGDGYTSIEISMLNPPSGLTMSGVIDYDTVRLSIVALCPSAKEKDVDVEFAVYAIGTNKYDRKQMRDVVTKGTLHIVAGTIN